MAEIGLGRYDPRGSGDPGLYSTVTNTLQWEDRVRTLKEIVQSGKFPCLVKVNKTDVLKYCPENARIRTSAGHQEDETLHVLELRRHKMVVAHKLQWDRRTGDYHETGKQSEINVTQKGWFEVLPENGQPVEYFDTINAIVGIRPKQFLVRTSIVGYQLTVENGVSCWMPWEIRPGEILTTGIIHMDQKKTKKKTLLKRIFSSNKNGGKREQDLKYLQCFDSEEREIMVPLIMTGVFSPVGDSANPNYDAVYSIHDLLSAFHLPVKAQLIHTDSQFTEKLPSGVVLFERLKDKETVLVARHPYVEGEDVKFEMPLNDEFPVVREKRKKQQKQQKVEISETNYENVMNDQHDSNQSQIDLPIRVKDTKKSKGSALLEKLSVRSKGKKERASLKALQEQGVFSSRLSKSEINFDDLCNSGVEVNNDNSDTSDTAEAAVRNSNVEPIKSKRDIDLENGYSVSTKQYPMRDRDLPPIPDKTRSPRFDHIPYKESVYEELPLAPRPPSGTNSYSTRNKYEHHSDMIDDGYMTPAKFRELNDYNDRDIDVIKSKPPTAPRDSLRYTRARKAKSEYIQLPPTFDDDPGETIDQMFEFTNNEESGYGSSHYERRKQNPTYSQSKYQTKREAQLFQRQISAEESRRFMDDSALESRSASGFSKMKSRSHKNLNLESNVTIRSHNVRKMRTAMEVFNFNDSLHDLRQPFQNGTDAYPEPMYGRIVDNERIKSYVYGQQNAYGKVATQNYVESEPAYRRGYPRSSSTAALSDMFPSRGDDSAISCGEYGFQGESEYSYSEYSKWQDDNWIPPDSISGLSVLEVSKSLRYIGMKDRVIIRFAHEQIDGKLLCTLDKKLLKEGFPELNALEIKKIVDFLGGWRPKK